MTTDFDSFDESPLGAFVESPLGARNAGVNMVPGTIAKIEIAFAGPGMGHDNTWYYSSYRGYDMSQDAARLARWLFDVDAYNLVRAEHPELVACGLLCSHLPAEGQPDTYPLSGTIAQLAGGIPPDGLSMRYIAPVLSPPGYPVFAGQWYFTPETIASAIVALIGNVSPEYILYTPTRYDPMNYGHRDEPWTWGSIQEILFQHFPDATWIKPAYYFTGVPAIFYRWLTSFTRGYEP